MTKADRIRDLDRHGIFTAAEIRSIIIKEYGACGDGYVRSVRQRADGRISLYDKRYYEKNGPVLNAKWRTRYRSDAKFRAKHLAKKRSKYHADAGQHSRPA